MTFRFKEAPSSAGEKDVIQFCVEIHLRFFSIIFFQCFTSVNAVRLSICSSPRGRLGLFSSKDLLKSKKLQSAQVLIVNTVLLFVLFCFHF